TSLSLGPTLPTTRGKTPITATVRHYGSDKPGKTRVQLWVGRARENTSDPALEMRLVQEDERDLGPSETTVSFSYQFTTPGDYVVQVRLAPDKLDLDDIRSVVVRVKDNVPVLLVNGKAAAEPLDTATEYLKTYLDPSEDSLGSGEGPRPVSLFANPKVISDSQ